jgi:hypothetical protein
MTTIDAVRDLALSLPRSYEAIVRDRVKFRVGRIVYLAFSRDESLMGFAFPKHEREGLVASEPDKFLMPGPGDLRYHLGGRSPRCHRRRGDAQGVPEIPFKPHREPSRLHRIGLGRAHAGAHVLVLVADLDVRVLTEEGTLLRREAGEPATARPEE